ncbi:MAG: FtsX-like permease family protein, partial [Candidatus Hodarchaeota archaeon]
MAKRKDVGLKGNIWWAPSYALTTIRNHRVRNIGIALILAISVSIPTTVFIWTATGTEIAVDDYFDENAYQMYLRSETDTGNYSHLEAASEYALASPFTEYSDVVSSSVCILQGDWPDWELYYYQAMLQYAMGIKDGRMIFVTNEVLEAASGELEYEGSFSLELGQVIVSRFFAETAALVHNITVEIGSQISLDLLQTAPIYNPHESDFRPPEELGRTRITNVTVVGIYEIAGLSTLAEMFPSFSRKNWDPFALAGDPVLGINDAVLVLQDQVDETVLENVNNRGYFSPVGLVRASKSGLMEAGIGRVSTHLFGLQAQIQERFPNVRVTALDEILDLNMHIQLYLQSQVLVVLALPVMIMSLMLTIFTSETSISYRRGEISALRAKGASFNQIFSAVIWESMILAIAGFAIGTLLSFMTAPLMEASTGLLTFDFTIYEKFLLNTVIPLQALVLGASVALFLPSAYLLHVARRIDVSEVGQPTSRTYYEVPEETNVWYYALGLGAVLTILVIMPSLLTPVGSTALLEVVIATILLFVASYLGSRAMRLVTAKASG